MPRNGDRIRLSPGARRGTDVIISFLNHHPPLSFVPCLEPALDASPPGRPQRWERRNHLSTQATRESPNESTVEAMTSRAQSTSKSMNKAPRWKSRKIATGTTTHGGWWHIPGDTSIPSPYGVHQLRKDALKGHRDVTRPWALWFAASRVGERSKEFHRKRRYRYRRCQHWHQRLQWRRRRHRRAKS